MLLYGSAVGFDVLSREYAYQKVHDQLVKSYAMDALRRSNGKTQSPSVDQAEAFKEKALQCRESRHESPGEGYDYRFQGDRVIGWALVYDEQVIHTAFFKTDDTDDSESDTRMSRMIDRLGFRQRR